MSLDSPQQNKLIPAGIQVLLNNMFAGDGIGMSGPEILRFFSQYSYEIERYPNTGAPSRSVMFEDCLARFDLDTQKRIIADLLAYDGSMKYARPSASDLELIRTWLGQGHTPLTKLPESVTKLNWATVNSAWQKAASRVTKDPDGAVTAARTLLESVCMHILDARQVPYERDGDLQGLYKKTCKVLTLSPDQQREQVFKAVLGGCAAIANGLAGLRNQFGDSHGRGLTDVEAKARHARLAVNAAGTVAQCREVAVLKSSRKTFANSANVCGFDLGLTP